MSSVTEFLNEVNPSDSQSSERLLQLVYRELRQLAAARLRREAPGQTLQATALVHEAYMRLVGSGSGTIWESRAQFFAAASEAMRRIVIDNCRRKKRIKQGFAGEVALLRWHDDARGGRSVGSFGTHCRALLAVYSCMVS